MWNPAWFQRTARVLIGACGPSVVTLVLAAVIWKAGPRDFITVWNDEVIYWNQAATFMRAGFDGGYVTVHEQPAAASFSHFGPHGPAFPVLYGSIAFLTGWRPYSPYIINLVLVAICAGVWMAVSRAGWSGALLVAGFWPLLYYLPSNMQDPLHFGLAFLLAALCEAQLTTRQRVIFGCVIVAVACVTRPTWALAIPAVMWGRDFNWRRRTVSIPVTIAAFLVGFVGITRMAAPYPYTAWIPLAVADPVSGSQVFARATVAGLRAFVHPHPEWIINLFRLQMTIALIAVAVLWRTHPAHRWRLETAILAVVPLLVAMFPVGDIESGREFHVMAPHVLFALLIVAPAGKRWTIVPAVVNLVICPTLYPVYVRHHDGRWTGSAEIRQFAQAVRGRVEFEPGTSGWDNTVLTHADALQAPLLGLPPGIGVSFVLDWEDQPVPPRSRYLLLRADRDAHIIGKIRLVELAHTPLGTLFRNEGVR